MIYHFPRSTSPVAHLLPAVGACLERVAPERAGELRRLTDGATLTLTDSAWWICQASPNWGLVQISTRVVELAWAFSYVYYDYYKRRLEGTLPMPGPLDLSGEDLQPSLRLLDWAVLELTDGRAEPWPINTPQPNAAPESASAQEVADELALCALAFFLHHELAHLYVSPVAGETATEHERACDEAAAEWILGLKDPDVLVLQKRAMGSAIGLLMLTARGIHNGLTTSESHPPGYERLLDVLHSRVPRTQDRVWGVVMGMLRLHAGQAGLPELPGGPYDDFMAAAVAYGELFRRQAASDARAGTST